MLKKPKSRTILPVALLGLAVISTPFAASAQQPNAPQNQGRDQGNDRSDDRRDDRGPDDRGPDDRGPDDRGRDDRGRDDRGRDNRTDQRGQQNVQRDGRYRIISTVNIRSGAGTNYRRVGHLRAGRVVEVDRVRNGWLHVRGQGWISGQFARRD